MKKINITITGALGRMGKTLLKEIRRYKTFKLYNLIDLKNIKFQGFKITKLNQDCFPNTDIIIDFSRPKACLKILKYALKFRKKLIIGTTGFTEKENKIINKASKKIAIFKSGNMSPGVNILEFILKIVSEKITDKYNIAISDDHHKNKIDYPSGTALMLANAIAVGNKKKLKSMYGKSFLNKQNIFTKNKINFFIKRKGKTIGIHSVQFNNSYEKIEIKHEAFSRTLFAKGALDAAIWLDKKSKGLFNMRDMYDLKL